MPFRYRTYTVRSYQVRYGTSTSYFYVFSIFPLALSATKRWVRGIYLLLRMAGKISTMNSTLQWWTASPGAEEEFGPDCITVGNLDNDPSGLNKVATGSFSGILRLYYPRDRDYRVDDLMLESRLDIPIIQLASGGFLGAHHRVALAVLHPRSLSVYTVSAVASSAGGSASYFTLAKAFDHQLERPAHSMCYGNFGGVSGRSLICVLSMDGCDCRHEPPLSPLACTHPWGVCLPSAQRLLTRLVLVQ